MPELPAIYYTSARGQCALMLLAALHDLLVKDSYLTVSKQQAIAYVQRMHWFEIEPDDLTPYETQREPRWHTLIAWARKDGVLRDLVSHHGYDEWGLTRRGRAGFERLLPMFRGGEWSVSKCFLWSQSFKKHIDPSYVPTPDDAKRPRNFYRRHYARWILADLGLT